MITYFIQDEICQAITGVCAFGIERSQIRSKKVQVMNGTNQKLKRINSVLSSSFRYFQFVP